MSGDLIGPYEVLDKIGQGGMGEVYKARDTRLDRLVALKFLTAGLRDNPEAEARFEQEARAASALEHPNVGTIYDIGTAPDGRRYMAMAFYPGHPLDHLLDAQRLSPDRAMELGLQVAEGLAQAHQRGIIHRDIKPSNVILTEDGVAKILDFGLAKRAGDEGLTRTGSSVGTPSYMAPEQVRGEDVDSRADVWSLGVLLYHMLADHPPFRGDSMQSTMYAVLESAPASLAEAAPGAPGPLVDLVERCLEKDREQRPANAGVVAAELKRLLGRASSGEIDVTVAMDALSGTRTIVTPSPVPRVRTGGRRRRVLLMGLGAAVLGAIVYVVVPKLLDSGDPVPLRVAVTTTTVASARLDSLQSVLVGERTSVAITRALIPLRGVYPVDARGVDPDGAAFEMACDEVFEARLVEVEGRWSVALKRRSAAGDDLWTDEFPAPLEMNATVAGVIAQRIAGAYAGRVDPSAALPTVRNEDYEVFLRLHAYGTFDLPNEPSMEAVLDSLAMIRGTSPGLLDAYLLEGTLLSAQFDQTRESSYLDRGFRVAEAAKQVAPTDSRVRTLLVRLAARSGDWDRADAEQREVERLLPGSVDASISRASLEWRKGDLDSALEGYRAAAGLGASKRDLYYYAYLAYQQGEIVEARRVLDGMLADFPDYTAARSLAAEMELGQGDVARAEQLYAELVAEAPNGPRWLNLGLARFLQGNCDAAAEAYREGQQLLGRAPNVLLNLADALACQGRSEDAARLYDEVVTLVELDPEAGSVDNRILKAQCLAQLKRNREAVAEITAALAESPDYSEARYVAALVYSLVGERTSALVHAEAALEMGVEPRWFSPPWFDELRNEPAFREAIGRSTNPAS